MKFLLATLLAASVLTVAAKAQEPELPPIDAPAPTDTAPTDGSPGTAFRQSFTTPWIALSRQLDAHDMVYASWGEGAESSVTPNAPFFKDKGLPQPLTRSRQSRIPVPPSPKTRRFTARSLAPAMLISVFGGRNSSPWPAASK